MTKTCLCEGSVVGAVTAPAVRKNGAPVTTVSSCAEGDGSALALANDITETTPPRIRSHGFPNRARLHGNVGRLRTYGREREHRDDSRRARRGHHPARHRRLLQRRAQRI